MTGASEEPRSKRVVWILTDEGWSPVAKRVAGHLDALGLSTFVLDEQSVKSLAISIEGSALRVMLDGERVAEPVAVLTLRMPIPGVPAGLPIDARRFHDAQWRTMLRGLLFSWHEQGIPMVNSPVDGSIEEKTAQLIRAAKVGFATPQTVHGAVPSSLTGFGDGAGVVAMKPFAPYIPSSPSAEPGKVDQRLLTNVIEQKVLANEMATSRVPAPTIVQEVVDSPREHRIVVVGDLTFGASARRDGLDGIDMRRPSVVDVGAEASDLPDVVRRRCIEVVRRSGLAMAVLDVLETLGDASAGGNSDWVFLELNPMGHFLWVEQLTGQPICEAIACLLARPVRHVR